MIWLLLLTAIGANTVYRAGHGSEVRTDLGAYTAAAQSVLAGQDPLGASCESRGWPYLYPPTLAVAMTAIASLPLDVAAAIWYLVSLAVMIGGLLALRAALRIDRSWVWRVEGVALGLCALPATSALARGQVGPLLLGLLGIAAWCLARNRDLAAGALVSLAVAIKVTPMLVLAGLVAARRWRAVAGVIAGLLLWLVVAPAPFLGWDGTLDALVNYGSHIGGGYAGDPAAFDPTGAVAGGKLAIHTGTNQSLVSLLARWGREVPAGVMMWTISVLVVGSSLWIARRHLVAGATGRDVTLAFAAMLAATLLVSPISWHHHFVLLFPSVLILAEDQRNARLRPVLGVFAVLSLLHFSVVPLRDLGLLGWGALFVFAALLTAAVRQRRRRAAQRTRVTLL